MPPHPVTVFSDTAINFLAVRDLVSFFQGIDAELSSDTSFISPELQKWG